MAKLGVLILLTKTIMLDYTLKEIVKLKRRAMNLHKELSIKRDIFSTY